MRVGGVMVAGVEVVVIGVNREGGQKRGEIGGGREEVGRTTGGLEVKKMIGRVRADEDGEIEVREGGVGRASATICAGCSGRCRSLWRQLSAAGPL